MKTKTVLMIISSMVFGMAILGGIAVVIIMFISSGNNDNQGALTEQTVPDDSATLTQQNLNDPSFVYLLQNQTNKLIRISLSDGTSQEFSLGLPEDASSYVQRLSFSDDGRLVAFCANDRVSDNLVTRRLVIRDIERQETIRESHFGNVEGCEVSAFNGDASEVAVGLVYNSPIMNAINFPNQPDWQLQINSVYESAIIRILSEGDANAPDYESMKDDFWFDDGISAMTRVVSFTEDEILFTAYPYIGRDGPLQVPAHRWDLQTGAVTPIDGLTKLGASYLPETGEVVYPELDESFDAAQPVGPMPLANTIRVNDNGEIRTIYRNSDYVIASTTFINGGRQIGVMLIGGWDENNPNEVAASRFEIINRDGSPGQLSSIFFTYNQMRGTADGMLVLSLTQLGIDNNDYQLVHYVDGEMRTVWSATMPRNQGLDLVWSAPMLVVEGLPAFAVTN